MFLEYVTRRVFFLSHFESLSNNQKLSDLTDHNISIHGRPIILIEPRSAGLKLDLFSFFFQPEQCFSLTTFQPEQCFLAKFQTSERDGIIVCHPFLWLHSMSCVQIHELLFRILSLSQLYTAKWTDHFFYQTMLACYHSYCFICCNFWELALNKKQRIFFQRLAKRSKENNGGTVETITIPYL